MAGEPRRGDLAYHWVINAKSLRDSKEVRNPLDTILRGQTTTTTTTSGDKNSNEKAKEIIRFTAFSIDSPEIPATEEHNRVEFDIYGYEFKEVAAGKTVVCHINHIQKGVSRTLGQTPLYLA